MNGGILRLRNRIEFFYRNLRSSHIPLYIHKSDNVGLMGSRQDSFRIYILQRHIQSRSGRGILTQLRRGECRLRRLENRRIIPEDRNDTGTSLLKVRLKLFLRLKQRKVKLGHKVLIHPRCAFLVVILELRASRHHQCQQHKEHHQR